MTWLDDLQLNTVIVERDGGPSLRGLKVAVYDDGILLRQVAVDDGESGWASIDGEHFTPRPQVIGIQILGGS